MEQEKKTLAGPPAAPAGKVVPTSAAPAELIEPPKSLYTFFGRAKVAQETSLHVCDRASTEVPREHMAVGGVALEEEAAAPAAEDPAVQAIEPARATEDDAAEEELAAEAPQVQQEEEQSQVGDAVEKPAAVAAVKDATECAFPELQAADA